ncbi:hypothetical protein [Streptomyces diastatochromogenes]|uniref:hypothetical protein n=1 Tax=Streptomyces diastatochromogenes TaxID=42236 RepID=UPI0036B3D95B
MLLLAETEYDLDGIALIGGDQLWFGDPWAPRLRTTQNRAGEQSGLYARRRLHVKRRAVVRASKAGRPVSAYLALPGQLELFHVVRDWSRVDERRLPAMTEPAREVLDGFVAHIRRRGWKMGPLGPSIRTLRVLLAYLGAAAPLLEEDVRLLARQHNFSGARVINYLRLTGLLAAGQKADAYLARARRVADEMPAPYAGPVHRWIDVLCGHGSRRSWPMAPSTIAAYTRLAGPSLHTWYDAGITDLRSVTHAHIEKALEPVKGEAAKSLATALRSLFRALKREKLIFRDPSRLISPTASARRLPVPLPEDHLQGVLERITGTRNKLIFVLAAVHALSTHDQRRLLLDDLDRSRGRLLVRRPGRLEHTIYLDELTFRLATAWLSERARRWPSSTNPYLLVTARTAVDDSHPRSCPEAINKPLRRLALQAGRLRADRILDEARHTADPVHLIRLFGLSPITATKYVRAAHPAGTHTDPTSA